MAVAIQATPSPRGRRFAVEPLEDRSLLSGFAVQAPANGEAVATPADHSSSELVELVELSSADEDDDAGESSREIVVEALPRQVVAAITDRFPAARLVAAEMDSDDGSLVFDVSAEWRGVEIEVELSPNGDFLEIGQTLEAGDLPQSVRDWIANNYPGATIQEVQRVSAGEAVNFELLFETSGDQTIEAVLRVPGDTPGVRILTESIGESAVFVSRLFDDSILGRTGLASRSGNDLQADENRSVAAEAEELKPVVLVSERTATGPAPQTAQPDAAESGADSIQETRNGSDTDGAVASHPDSAGMNRISRAIVQSIALPDPLHRAVTTIAAVAVPWLPQVAQVLVDVFPLDTAALERSLQQFLDEIDSLAGDAASTSLANRLTPRLLLAAATLAGAERLITQMNRTRRDPVLTSAGGKSTWTWVLNLSDSE
jgi:hypothetical protein